MTLVFREFFLEDSGGSENMAVDGSVTPVVFDLSNETYTSIDVGTVNAYIEVGGNINSYTDFMSIPGLTNGCNFEFSTVGNTYDFELVKTNRDLLKIFSSLSSFVLREIGNNNHFRGSISIPIKGSIIRSDTGFAMVTIQDDLTALDYFTVSVQGIVTN